MKARNSISTAALAMALAAAAFFFVTKYFAVPSEIRYAGSTECARCHESIYARWKNTLHAGALIHGGEVALLPEAGEAAERHLRAGETAGVEFAIGRHWTRRYLLFNKRVSPFVYSIVSRGFSDYYDKNYRRSDYELECAGCHTTGAFATKAAAGVTAPPARRLGWAEPGVACEACHGPGSAHIEYGSTAYITNPKKLTPERRDMICMSCHTNGRDKSGEFKFALGYKPGGDLQSHFFAMVPKPGQLKYNRENRFGFLADGSFADRARQFEYWKFMFFAKEGFSCEDCLDFRGPGNSKSRPDAGVRANESPEFFSVSEYCMSCHASRAPFAGYDPQAAETAIQASKCDFVKKRIRLENARGEYSCGACHSSQSVHDHFYVVESVVNGRR